MSSLRRVRLRDAWWARAVTIGLVMLVLATGFCLLDPDCDTAHATRPDLCAGVLVATVITAALTGPEATGRAPSPVVAPPYAVALRVPSPPPRLLLS
jgi:hypothetical protein